MASKQDIVTAIKNLDLFLKIPELKGAKPRLNPNGSPFAFAGGFNMVFQLIHNSKKWAFRVWHVPIGENKDRYLAISKYLTDSKLPFFADFIYEKNGLLVNGELTDTIRMEWLDGLLLKEYIEKHLHEKLVLEKLANDFLIMAKTLRECKISHGDLQEGNILIDEIGQIKLVDYDSVCIPEIEGQAEIITGLKGYQHPSRFKSGKASLKADYFSELVIYISILGVASNPNLWYKYQLKEINCLLFNESDFENLESSLIYSDLIAISPFFENLIKNLINYLKVPNYLNIDHVDIPVYDDNCLPFFCLKNKVDLTNYIKFESFVKRLWDRIDLLTDNEFVSCHDIFVYKIQTKRSIFSNLLGFSSLDFIFEMKNIQVLKDGKTKTMQEADALLSERFGIQYHKLLEKIS